jgi:signal transduction histidine kinase
VKWRLAAAFVALIVLVLAAQDIPLANYLKTVETERFTSDLERDAFVIAGTAEKSLSPDEQGTTADLQSAVSLYSAREGAIVVITNALGIAVVVSDSSESVGEDYSNRPEVAGALAGSPTSGTRYSNTLDGELAFVAVPVLSGPELVGTVRITYPATQVQERVNERVRGLYLVAGISLLCAVMSAIFIAGTLTRPLSDLRRATKQLAEGDLQTRADEKQGPPEIKSLAKAFNEMTARIRALINQQRAFASDASHQLRTPLTALRLQLDQGADLIDVDPAAARLRIEAASAETERLQQLVSGLLVLAQAEHSVQATEPIDVGAVVAERAELWGTVASERDITVEVDGDIAPLAVMALAVPGGFEQMLDNLIDNAINVSPQSTTIQLAVATVDDRVEVQVRDQGPGMREEQLAYARNRFWRAPDATHQGTGLGLAIVDHLANASGGELRLANRDGGGFVVTISLRKA